MAFEAELKDQNVINMLNQMRTGIKKIDQRNDRYIGLLSALVFRDIQEHFKNEEGPDGKWTAWSAVYSMHMAKIGKSHNKFLQDTGRMKNTFQPGSMYRKIGDGIMWYNPAKTQKGFPYAAAHDEGGPKLPARPFMWLSDKAMEKISSSTLKFITGKGNK